MGKNDRFIAIFIGLGIWTLVIFQFLEPKSVNAQHEPHTHEEHKHSNFSLLDHINRSSDISSLRKDLRRLIESCVVIEEAISC